MQDLQTIRAFHAICRYKSITNAAKHLNQSKATLSRRIIKLEMDLDCSLIVYDGNKQVITKAGEIFFEYCERLIQLSEESIEALRHLDTKISGELIIVSSLNLIKGWLTKIIDEFLDENPDVTIKLLSQYQDTSLETEPDIVLSIGQKNTLNWRKETVDHWHYGVFASEEYISHSDEITHPRDLSQHKWVKLNEPEQEDICLIHPIEGSFYFKQPSSRINSDNSILHLASLIKGKGIGLMPVHMGDAFNRRHSGKLIRCLPEWKTQPMEIISYTPKGRQAQRVTSFLNKLRNNRVTQDKCIVHSVNEQMNIKSKER